MQSLIFCGYKSSGKTTLARQYAQVFSVPFIDTDHLMVKSFYEKKAPTSVAQAFSSNPPLTELARLNREIYQTLGAPAFRALETSVIQAIKLDTPSVIAVGGGAMLALENVQALRKLGCIIYLRVQTETLLIRLLQQKEKAAFCPEGTEQEKFYRQDIARRARIYAENSDYTIDIDRLTVDLLLQRLHQIALLK